MTKRLAEIGHKPIFGYLSLFALQLLIIGRRLPTWDLPGDTQGSGLLRDLRTNPESYGWRFLADSDPYYPVYYQP